MMRSLIPASVAAALSVVALPLVDAQPFEGVITMNITAGGRQAAAPMEASYYASRTGKARIEMTTPVGKAAILISPADSKLFVIIDALGQYMEQDVGKLLEPDTAVSTVKFERTGKKETIAGHECEIILIDEMSVCAAKGLGSYLNIGSPFGQRGNVPAWQSTVINEKLFPLRVQDAAGNTQLLVTKVERKSVDPDLFRVPSGFTRMAIPGT